MTNQQLFMCWIRAELYFLLLNKWISSRRYYPVGCAEGCPVGWPVGWPVGCGVGKKVGRAVGDDVGSEGNKAS
jgi:hypothetical protein